ncbi:hypothetical protein [Rhizosphaericola mali]|uniref:Carboxypeptidase regulatory-like domain-containing protein n=1 Tax=Rhizosphaericola mali TaxID=2545455 RepID=A0A5P2G0W0_9BACT|nr:hypothetical protein [Rhizosphaericola mali]QES89446.1 hypothetical protein E0W69_012485 [Rhizosphaericola mali]
MYLKTTTIGIIVIITFFSYNAKAQRADKILNAYINSNPSEEAYLQLDNNLYSSNDTIWFKAYVLANANPSSYSYNLYTDWFDDNGKLIEHQVYPIVQGRSDGQFAIPSVYSQQKIHLLAYTKWMLNSDTDFLFRKDIEILPHTAQTITPSKKETQKTILQFFPEGGNLVAGILNKIAFKATDQYGKPVDVIGVILDNHHDSIADIFTQHDGMGYFYLHPEKNTNYIAQYHTSSQDSATINLPSAQSSGIAMQVISQKDNKKIVIRKQDNNASTTTENNPPDTDYNQLHLLAEKDGIINYLSNINLSGIDNFETNIPIQKLSSGILTITILDQEWHPLAERICFIKAKDINFTQPNLSVITPNLQKKGLNTIQLQYDDSLPENLSIAITDGSIPIDTTSNIISYLLLTGQLKGKINNPAYYFEDTSKQKLQDLDLVMLTNGWRKYNWKAIVQGEKISNPYRRDSAYFFLQGSITDVKNKKKLPKEISFITNNKLSFSNNNFIVDKEGHFGDSSFLIYTTTKLTFHPTVGQRTYAFNFNKFSDPSFTKYPYSLSTSTSEILQKIQLGKLDHFKTTLQDVTVTSYKTTYANPIDSLEAPYQSPEFINAPALKNVYVMNQPILAAYGADFIGFLRAKLHMDIDVKPHSPYITPICFVNGQEMPIEAAFQTPIIDIVFLKYYKYFVGAPGGGGNGGALAIWTKQGFPSEYDFRTKNDNPTSFTMTGYTISKDFYSPNYSSSQNDNNAIIDQRKTLYWNPEINLDNKEHKNIQLSFYNSDIAKSYKIIIEGFRIDGTPIYIEKNVE